MLEGPVTGFDEIKLSSAQLQRDSSPKMIILPSFIHHLVFPNLYFLLRWNTKEVLKNVFVCTEKVNGIQNKSMQTVNDCRIVIFGLTIPLINFT